MKAIVFNQFGMPDVLRLIDVDIPTPTADEVLIRVKASSVTKYDCWVRSCTAPAGFKFILKLTSGKKPKQPILGTELSGEVVSFGANVSRFTEGDAVFGYTALNLGAHAEFICLSQNAVAKKPNNISFAQAAVSLQGGMTAHYFMEKANIKPSDKVLILGASGGVGGYAVQLAKRYYGAEVTGVCSSAKMDYVKSLGTDHVIDYQHDDFTNHSKKYNVIFDTVGKFSIARSRKFLAENGTYILATFSLAMFFQMLWYGKMTKQHFVCGVLQETLEGLLFIKDQIEAGVIRPVIDKTFSYEDAVNAHKYVESGQKKGYVALLFNPEE